MAGATEVVQDVPVALRSRRRMHSARAVWVKIAALVVSLATLLPIGFIIDMGVRTGWPVLSTMLFRQRVAELLLNTVLLAAV
ncbi:MAG: hypothetical protein U1E70_29800, partial [Acetobacteraceae bacterium]